MDKQKQIKISKFISYILRHRPDSIGIKLDRCG
jgi:RNA:NAD 2'-phosphotransferase (TPT1/KptA family)